MNPMNELNDYLKAFSSLHTARIKGRRAPHKAVLLLAIIELVERAEITSPRIELTDALCHKFTVVWKKYVGESAIFTADIGKPYFHMQHELFWCLVERHAVEGALAAEPHPVGASKEEKKSLPRGGYSIKAMRRAFAYAEVDDLLFQLLQNSEARAALKNILLHEYFK